MILFCINKPYNVCVLVANKCYFILHFCLEVGMRSLNHYCVVLLAACSAIVPSTIFFAQPAQATQGTAGAGQGGVSVERGKYLLTVQDCNGCHTPFKNGEPDMTKMLSGHPQDAPKITSAP